MSEVRAPHDADDDPGRDLAEARRELVVALRGGIAEHIRGQHQLAVLSGALATVGATLITTFDSASPWVALGFSVLFIAISFEMLNYDEQIVASAAFILEQDIPAAQAQREWEQHLGQYRAGLLAVLRNGSRYIVPALGILASSIVFVTDHHSLKVLVCVPAILCIFLLHGVIQVVRGYRALSE